MTDDELIRSIHELTKLVQMEFDSLLADEDRAAYEARIAELDQANKVAETRGLDVPRKA